VENVESGLYIVATPIGNVADFSSRAIEVLSGVDLIAAEDTRHSGHLLQTYGIDTRTVPYHDHSDARALRQLEDCVQKGGAVALISDAGTPLISDPGYKLVRHMQELGIAVRAIPGPCAAVAALSVAGLPTDRFHFEGFLPAKENARHKVFQSLAARQETLVFYEAPHRVLASLQAMSDVFGAEREATLAREITKTFETIHRATLEELVLFVKGDENQQKGEIVLTVAGAPKREAAIDEQTSMLLQRIARELPAKKAAAIIADCTSYRKNELYDHLLGLETKG
jgi:16S rRNA (cytidine1402-2'-O)-methyltransferase